MCHNVSVFDRSRHHLLLPLGEGGKRTDFGYPAPGLIFDAFATRLPIDPLPVQPPQQSIDGYSGVVTFCLGLFLLNIFVKVALLYSSIIIAVHLEGEGSGNSVSSSGMSHISASPVSLGERRSLDVPACDIEAPSSPGVPGLISPGPEK